MHNHMVLMALDSVHAAVFEQPFIPVPFHLLMQQSTFAPVPLQHISNNDIATVL